MTDWGALYAEHVADLTALAGSLEPTELEVRVPGTPAWTVRDVYAHLAGVVADGLADRTDGAPGEEWTARQVAERSGAGIDELTAELQSNVEALQSALAGGMPPGPVWDMAVHHADLHEALGKHRLADPLWAPALEAVGQRVPEELAAAAPPYEVFRAVFSRRSRAQMQAWDSGLTPEQLAEVPVFGARDDDQPVPADA